MYVYMSAATLSEIIAWKAVEDPMLIRLSKQDIAQESAMALTGIFLRGCTCAIHLANGSPLSLANANVCRDVDALKKILLKITGINIIAVNPLTPAVLTALRKT
jgi:hypothetical protein